MAVQKVIQVGAINIAVHPHPDGVYEKLIRKIYKLRRSAQVYGDRGGLISQLYTVEVDGKTVAVEGVISTFTEFDASLPWFNANTADDASDADLGEIKLPDHLMPNHRRCQFYFDLASHTFLFDTASRKGGIAPRSMLKFLESILSDPKISAEFGTPRLTVIPDSRSVSEVVEWSKIKSLTIRANRPNPDYDEDDLREFEESLDSQNADRIELKLVAQPHEFLDPSARTQTLAAIAADNGYVEARGENELGQPEVRSTKDKKPLQETEYFDPDVEDSWSAFKRFASSVASDIRRRRRQRASAGTTKNVHN